VAAVAPGGVNTPMMHRGDPEAGRALLKLTQPWPDAGEPEDIAEAVAFLASDAARFVTGEVLVVDGGLIANGSGLTTRFGDARPMAGLVGRDTGSTGQEMILRPAA
jgi:NAD(P)-dependent dehydrogenase (short-subunit alcohol dehydrogenase family)